MRDGHVRARAQEVVVNFAFVDFPKNQKIMRQAIARTYFVACLLSNCRACLYPNQIAQAFACTPPTLEYYLDRLYAHTLTQHNP